jgi:hypothetical protein
MSQLLLEIGTGSIPYLGLHSPREPAALSLQLVRRAWGGQFSTFKTQRPQENRNDIAEGQTQVVGIDP